MVYQHILNKEFGTEWVDWLPETLYQEIDRLWGVVPSEEVSNKLGALKVFLTTDLFYHDASVFEHIVQAINDSPFDPDEMTLSAPDEIEFTLRILGPFDPKMFEREIVAYIRTCCEASGLLVYPPSMRFAQPEYTKPELKKAVKQIKPRMCEDCSSDLVAQQSKKLYEVTMSAVDKLTAFESKYLAKDN